MTADSELTVGGSQGQQRGAGRLEVDRLCHPSARRPLMAGRLVGEVGCAAPSGRVRAIVGPSRQGRGPVDDDRLHLQMSPPPEPTWRLGGESRLGKVMPIGRVFIVLGIVCAIFALLAVASISCTDSSPVTRGCCG